MNKWIFILFIFQMIVSCNNEPKRTIVARVYDAEMTMMQLNDKLKNNSISNDSNKYAEIIINNWILEQTLLHGAQNEELNEFSAIEEKTIKYKNQLMIHYYQNKLIEERMDTVVSYDEIKTFFNSHKADFQLKDYLVKVLYIKVSEDAPELEKLRSWYKLKQVTDETNIIQYAGLYASNFYYDKANWIYFDEITKEIPLTDINKDRFITRKSEIKFKENGYYYFLNVLDYKLKNATSPIEFEKDNIKERILNKRVLNLRNTINQELIQKANNENAITTY